MRAYKFIEPQYLAGALSGRLLLRPLHAYASLENGLADDLDGAVRLEWPGRRVGKLGREHGLAATVSPQFSLIHVGI